MLYHLSVLIFFFNFQYTRATLPAARVVPSGQQITQEYDMIQPKWDANKSAYVLWYTNKQQEDSDFVRIYSGKFGRTGNQFQVLQNALFDAVFCNHIVTFQSEDLSLISSKGIQYADMRDVHKGITANKLHFKRKECVNEHDGTKLFWLIAKETELQNVRDHLALLLARVALAFTGTTSHSISLGEPCHSAMTRPDLLVGHIRSGDIAQLPKIYLQPPFAYWWHEISNPKYNRVIIYTEDMQSPVARILSIISRTYKKLEVRVSRPLREVVGITLCAKNLIYGFSSLVGFAASSWNVHRLVLPYGCMNDIEYFQWPVNHVVMHRLQEWQPQRQLATNELLALLYDTPINDAVVCYNFHQFNETVF
jgi:hypothetical protein